MVCDAADVLMQPEHVAMLHVSCGLSSQCCFPSHSLRHFLLCPFCPLLLSFTLSLSFPAEQDQDDPNVFI